MYLLERCLGSKSGMKAVPPYTKLYKPARTYSDSPDPQSQHHTSKKYPFLYLAKRLNMLQILLTNFLALRRIEIKLIKARMQELVRAYNGLFELGEAFRELELLDIG